MYWTRETCSVGDVIQVPIQNRKVWAVVAHVASVHEVKEYIKSQSFVIKKIDTLTKTDTFSREFILAVLETSRYFVVPFGEVFSELIPKKVLENIEAVTLEPGNKPVSRPTLSNASYIQKPTSDRIAYIQKLQQEKTTFVFSPTKSHNAFLKQHNVSHTCMPIDAYKLDTAPTDTACVVELASSDYYRHIRKGFDFRFFIRDFCARKHIELIYMDTVLLETENRKSKNPIAKNPELHLISLSVSGKAKTKTKQNLIKKQTFFSPELISLLKHCQKNKESILLYVVRKGFSHQTICADCGTTVTCPICSKPLRLDASKNFVCDSCHTQETSNRACANCGSWNLIPFGVSTEHVAEQLKDILDIPIHIIDSSHHTKSTARKKIKEQYGVYIGTELLLTQSYETIYTYGAIVSLETLLALPDTLAELKAIQVITTLMDRVSSNILIQTRSEDAPIWKALEAKDWSVATEHIKTQLEQTDLPPYTTSIHVEGREKDIDLVEKQIERYGTNKIRIQNKIYITFTRGIWPKHPLQGYLQALPSHIHIEVDKTDFV